MSILKRIPQYIIMCCVSFTVCVMILSAIHTWYDLMATVAWVANFELFAVCLAITILMFFTDSFTENLPLPVVSLIQFADVILCVFGLGGLVFDWFPINFHWFVIVFAIDAVIYLLVFLVMYYVNSRLSNEINEKIKERKNHHEKSH